LRSAEYTPQIVDGLGQILSPIAALALIALASREIGGWFRRGGLPLISGVLPLRSLGRPGHPRSAVRRGRHTLISHGETRFRSGDWVTLPGSESALAEVVMRFEGEAHRPQEGSSG